MQDKHKVVWSIFQSAAHRRDKTSLRVRWLAPLCQTCTQPTTPPPSKHDALTLPQAPTPVVSPEESSTARCTSSRAQVCTGFPPTAGTRMLVTCYATKARQTRRRNNTLCGLCACAQPNNTDDQACCTEGCNKTKHAEPRTVPQIAPPESTNQQTHARLWHAQACCGCATAGTPPAARRSSDLQALWGTKPGAKSMVNPIQPC